MGFVVQGGSRAVSAGADQTEGLPDEDLLAGCDERLLGHVAVASDDTCGVLEVDVAGADNVIRPGQGWFDPD